MKSSEFFSFDLLKLYSIGLKKEILLIDLILLTFFDKNLLSKKFFIFFSNNHFSLIKSNQGFKRAIIISETKQKISEKNLKTLIDR